MSTVTVRAVRAEDLPQLLAWLPAGADEQLPVMPADAWLLALRADKPQAMLRVRSGIGRVWPRYWFHVGCVVHAAPDLGLYHRQTTLLLGNDHTGASELAHFSTTPGLTEADQAMLLRALLRAAWGHMAQWRSAHPGPVIFELPGVRDAQGQSPFWQSLGRHFFDGDPAELARRRGPHWPSELALLLPRQPVYAAFLGEPGRAAIGQAGAAVRAWMDVLGQEGLRYSHHVGIVDGGPVFEVHLDAQPPERAR